MQYSDESIFELSGSDTGDYSIFEAKKWVVITDQNTSQYSSNQLTITTEALSNNSSYASMSEAYLQIPMTICLTTPQNATPVLLPATAGSSVDTLVNLRSWYGNILSNFSLEIAGATVITAVQFQSIWNTFKMNMSFSYDSVSQWSSIGFYPESSQSVNFTSATANGDGIINTTTNNNNVITFPVVNGQHYSGETSNIGFQKRQSYFNLDPDAYTGSSSTNSVQYSSLVTTQQLQTQFKSYIFNKINQTASVPGVWQCQIVANVYLADIADFFKQIPLSRGLYMTIRAQLNNSSVTFATGAGANTYGSCSVQIPSGGVSPLQLSALNGSLGTGAQTYTLSLSVGAQVLNSSQQNMVGVQLAPYKSVQLYVPVYDFVPRFGETYMSQAVRSFEFEDITCTVITNSLAVGQSIQGGVICTSISDAQSVLIVPFYEQSANGGLIPYQSPFSGEGTCSSPFAYLSNLQFMCAGTPINSLVISKTSDAYLHYLQGCRSLNGNTSRMLTSGLISQQDFETNYLYYYCDVSRSFETAKTVPKQYTFNATNGCNKALQLVCFCSYKRSFTFDINTGRQQ